MTEVSYHPTAEHSALLVMDYQPAVVGSLPNLPELLRRVQSALATFRRHGGQIVFVRVAFDADDITAIPAHSRFSRIAEMARDRLHKDVPATAVHEEIAPQPQDIVVRKTRVGAFSSTDLEAQLRARGITTLFLCGVSTSGVVLSTVRDAHDRDYALYVLADATTDAREDIHEFLTRHVLPTQAEVIEVDQIEPLLSDRGGQ